MNTMINDTPEKAQSLFKKIISENQGNHHKYLKLLHKLIDSDLLLIASIDAKSDHLETCLVLRHGIISDNFSYVISENSKTKYLKYKNYCCKRKCKDLPIDIITEENLKINNYIEFPIKFKEQIVGMLASANHKEKNEIIHLHFIGEIIAEKISEKLTSEQYVIESRYSQQIFDEICAISDIGAWEFDVISKKLRWSKEVYRIYGVPFDSVITPDFAISFYEDTDRKRIESTFNSAVLGCSEYISDFRFSDNSGKKKWVRTSGKVDKDANGNPLRIYGAIQDVTSEKKLLQEEKNQRSYLKGILDSLDEAVITIDELGNIVGSNSSAAIIFGYSSIELANMKVNSLMPEPYCSQHDAYMEHYRKTGNAKIIGVGRQLPAKRKNGEIFQMELALSKYIYDKKIYYTGIVRDITKRIEANDKIYKLAFIDSITGLKNKSSFEQEIKTIASGSDKDDTYAYVAYIDIDGLAGYNLAYGTETANKIINHIATKITSIANRNLEIYKFNSDEFILISKKFSNKSEIEKYKYKSLENYLLKPDLYKIIIKNEKLNPSISLASLFIPISSINSESLIDSLEYSMKKAKRHKPFGYFFLGHNAKIEYERIKLIKSSMPKALRNKEFSIALQPQYNHAHKIYASEALIRWNSHELGTISPGEFIPLAEENDDIILIGDWVIETVCKLLGDLKIIGVQTSVSINISSRQIAQLDFEKKLHYLTKKYGVTPESIMLELTETTLISDIELVKKKMFSLSKLGFRFSVDDFGTGYSSLMYIKELPISELKIDKYFIDGIGHKDGFRATNIVNVIIDMAKVLNLAVIAEGVESEQQFTYLQKRGCDAFQGYFLSKPLSVEDWLKELTAHRQHCS